MAGTVALVVVVGILLLAAWDLYKVRSELEAGRSSLDDLTLDLAAEEGIARIAGDAAGHLSAAEDRAHGSFALGLLSPLPVVGDQVEGIRRMTSVTAGIGTSAVQAADRLDAQLSQAGEGAGRVALLDVALEEIDRISADLAEVDLGSPAGLVGPLEDAHHDLVESITDAQDKLAEGRDLVQPVRTMLAGPSDFLLLAANNAEMAGGAGLALSAGMLTFDGGEISLGEVVPARWLRLTDSVPLPGDLRQIYSPTGVGIDFRSSTRSPNLPVMGPVISDMLATFAPDELDGVIIVDAVALQALMQITGGVEVEGRTIDAENVLSEILNENYKRFEGEGRSERDSYQGDIAKAVFDVVTERDVPAAKLASALLEASKGRHLLLWSQDEALQDVWSEMGVSGELDPNGLMISFQNYAANKLDWYLRPEASLDVGLTPSGDYRATLKMTLPVPPLEDLDDASSYILGPGPETQGLFLTAHLPEAAYDIVTPDPPGFRTKGMDGPMHVRTFLYDVPLGTTFERTIEFTLPRENAYLVLLPSARLEPLPLVIDGTFTITDAEPIVFSWLAAIPADDSEGIRLPVRVLAVLGLGLTVVAAGALATSVMSVRRERHDRSRRFLVGARVAAIGALVVLATSGIVAAVLSIPRV